ncbi:MAG: S8 family serine peptidase, partial [Acidobacteriota bacterium]
MKLKKAFLIASLAVSLAVSLPSGAQSQEQPRRFRKGEVVVEIEPDASIDAVNARIGTTTKQRLYGTNFYLLRTPKGKKEAKYRKRLERDPDVLSASLNPTVTNVVAFARTIIGFPDGYASPGKTQADFRGQQQLFDLLQLTQAQARSKGRGAVVAIIDTGVDFNHQALQPRLWIDDRPKADIAGDGIDNDEDGLIDDFRGWDFYDNDNDPSEAGGDPKESVAGHGTFIAGLIALVAPECRIMPIRAFPPDGVTDEFNIASAIKYAADNGANIINLSFGSNIVSPLLTDAINYARERGAVMVAASGNENSEAPQFPSSSPDVMGVSATDLTDHRAPFSNFGPHIDISAPGVQLISSYIGDSGTEYAMWSGTSFAAPFAVAEAALIYSLDPDHPDIRRAIEDTAFLIDDKNPGYQGRLGRGRVNLLRALECLNTDCTRPVRDLHAEAALVRAPGVTYGSGHAEINIYGSKQEFEVEASELNPRTTYRLSVNGVLVDQARQSNNLGYLKFYFSSDSPDFPASGIPNPVTGINHIELREFKDTASRILLTGDIRQINTTTPVKKEALLYPTSAAVRSGGKAKIEVTSERETFTVEAEKLSAAQFHQVVVDGVNISLPTDISTDGYFKLVLTSDGSNGRVLPPSLRPAVNIRHVEIRNLSGEIILQGDFRPGGIDADDGGGGTTTETSREASFVRTGADADAEGKAKTKTTSDGKEGFSVELINLAPVAAYRIFVDGSLMGSFTADSAGRLKREWSSETESGKLPLPARLRPVTNIRRVEIRNASNVLILVAEFA